jgi:4-hydroxymandelate oxidase
VHALLAQQERAARERLDPVVFDYYAAGSGDEVTASEAETAWREFRLRPRVLRDVADVDVTVQLPGALTVSPFVAASMAFQSFAHPQGECAMLTGAGDAAALAVLSTRSSRRIEEVAGAATGPWWFQAYGMRYRSLTHSLVRRAAAAGAGAGAIVLTVDTPYVGRKGPGGRH